MANPTIINKIHEANVTIKNGRTYYKFTLCNGEGYVYVIPKLECDCKGGE